MIPIEKLRAVQTIIVHDHCADGLMSAILLKDAYSQLGLNPEVKFVQYGTEAYKTLTPTPNTLFCDFSPFVPEVEIELEGFGKKKVPDPEIITAWAGVGTIMLDHHKGAKGVVTAMPYGLFGDEATQPGVSGALLAYRAVWLPFYVQRQWQRKTQFGENHQDEPIVHAANTFEELATQLENDLAGVQDFHDKAVADTESEVFFAHDLATVAGIRDTWLNKHPRFRESCVLAEVLRFYPNEDWLADNRVLPFHPGNRGFWAERLKLGDLLWTKHEKSVKKCIEKSWRFTTPKGTRVLVFEGVRTSSDVAEAIDAEADLIMAFDYEVETPKQGGAPERKVIFSTRSHTTFNCMEMCKGFGGGGHTKAAGFNVIIDPHTTELSKYAYTQNPYALAETLVRLHEEKQQQGT